jgi:hypothetical protein
MPGKTDTKAGYFDKLKGLLDGGLIYLGDIAAGD